MFEVLQRTSEHRGAALLLLIGVVLVGVLDRVAMHTGFDEERRLLEDIGHEPEPDGIEINRDGIRDTREATAFPGADRTIVMLGDSFVYGEHLRPAEALPQRLEELARQRLPERVIRVANFGWPSASPYLSHRRLERLGALYRPDLVILCIDMSDMHDDIRYMTYDRRPGLFRWLGVLPSAVLSLQGAARRLGIHEAIFGYPGERYFALERPLSATRPHFTHLEHNINVIAAQVNGALGAEFLLLILPRDVQYAAAGTGPGATDGRGEAIAPHALEPLRYFAELARRVDYPVRSLLPVFETMGAYPTTFDHDPHWTAAGSAVAAEAVWRILIEEELL